MIVIYHCYGGAHSSVVAAAVHLGLLPRDRKPSPDELWSVRYFDKQDSHDAGRIRLMGTDCHDNEIYILGRRSDVSLIRRAVEEVGRLMGVWPEGQVLFVDTLPCVNWYMRIGGFLSRAARLKRLGRPTVIYGTRRAYRSLSDLAASTLGRLEAQRGPA